MLYDPKWDQQTETKADPFKLRTLIAWLEQQKSTEKYEYMCNGHCLLARYFAAHGFQNVTMWAQTFWHGETICPDDVGQEEALRLGKATQLPPNFNRIAVEGAYTFGAALGRARKFVP